MRVLIDPQAFLVQRVGGVSRLFAELAKGLDHSDDVDLVLPFRYTRTEYLARDFPDRMRLIESDRRLLRARALGAVNAVTRLPTRPVDVVHSTYYWPEYLNRYRTKKRVATVLDMIPELMPELHEPGPNPHRRKRDFLEAADAIVCISETTRTDLLRCWGDFGKPVHVAYLGVDARFFAPTQPTVVLPKQYVLFVGMRSTYKNFSLLADAFAETAGANPDLHLVAVGGGPFDAEETEFFERHGLADRVHQMGVSDTDLPGVYAGAMCMVFASRYEGFGLPVLEAFAARCPVVIADTPCLVEVAGGLATVVSPDDPAELVSALKTLIEAGRPDTAGLDSARARAAEFTWERMAAETLGIYRQTLTA